MTVIAFPGHAGRCWPLARWRSHARAIDQIRARVTTIVRPGEVFVPFHWDERCANRLTIDDFDPISREPNYEQCAVQITRTARR